MLKKTYLPLLIAVLVIPLVAGFIFRDNWLNLIPFVYSDDISDIEDEIADTEKLKEEKESILDDIQSAIDDINNSNLSISGKINALSGEIDVIQKEIDVQKTIIEEQQDKLQEKLDDFEVRLNSYKQMINQSYKASRLGVLDIFLSKDNGRDLFRTYELYKKVSEKQNQLLSELSGEMSLLEEQVQDLQFELNLIAAKKQGLDEAYAALKNEQAVIRQQLIAKAGIQNAVKKDIANINTQLKTLSSELTSAINVKIGAGGDDPTGGGNYGGGTSPQPATGEAGIYDIRINGISVDMDASGPIRVVSTSNTNVFRVNGTLRYRGILEMRSDSNMFLINELPFEQYLYGLGEVPSSWHIEALKTQSVAGRSYAIKNWNKRTAEKYNLRDDVYDQNYVGYSKESSSYGDSWVSAVNATNGTILKYGSDIVATYYHSTCGGHTLSSAEVWGGERGFAQAEQDRTLQRDSWGDLLGYDSASSLDYKKWCGSSSQVCGPNDNINDAQMMDLANATIYLVQNPSLQNNILPTALSATEIESVLGENSIQNKIGVLQNVQSVYDNGTVTVELATKKTSYVRITGSTGSYDLPASQFWTVFNVRAPGLLHIYFSNLWTVHKENGSWNFYTRGYGHRVGMCQYGAQGRAVAGQSYTDILTHYYRGTSLATSANPGAIRVGITRVGTGDITVSSQMGGAYLVYANGSLVTTVGGGDTLRVVKQ